MTFEMGGRLEPDPEDRAEEVCPYCNRSFLRSNSKSMPIWWWILLFFIIFAIPITALVEHYL